ncbi:ATP-dependent helicase, partial [Kitasatospora sp. NPDC048239]
MNRSSRSPYQNTNSRSAASSRSGGSGFYGSRPAGGRRPSGQGGRQGSSGRTEFAMPVSTTPALPAVEAFDELDMPKALLSVL